MVRKLFALPFIATCLAACAALADPAPPRAPAPDILVVGDSQAQGVAGALQRRYLRSKDFHVVDKSKIGTGLTSRSTYDWDAEEWSVPVNFMVGQIIKIDKKPVQITGGVRYWPDSPEGGAEDWGGRLVVTYLFPKG